MSTDARTLILNAVQAGRYDQPPSWTLACAISDGDDVPFETLAFDSLAWMEFCISIEINAGLELTPSEVAEMRSLGDVERWIVARTPA